MRTAIGILNSDEKRVVVTTLFLNLGGMFIELVLVGMMPLMVSILVDRSALSGVPLANQYSDYINSMSESSLLATMAIVLISLTLIKILYFYLTNKYFLIAVHKCRVRLATTMLTAAISAEWKFHLDTNSAEIQRNCDREVNEYLTGIVIPMQSVIMAFLMLTGVLFLIVTYLPLQALMAFLIIVVGVGLLFLLVRKRIERAGKVNQLERKNMIKFIQEAINNIVDAKLHGKERWFVSRYEESLERFSSTSTHVALINKTIPYVTELFSIIGLFAVIVLVAGTKDGVGNVLPEVALITIGVVRIRQAVGAIVASASRIQFSVPSISNISEYLFSLKSENLTSTTSAPSEDNCLRISDLNFAFDDQNDMVLKDLNIQIEYGSSVALVGETGCGKSTFLHVLTGLLDPTSGTVTDYGVNVHLNKKRWRNKIGFVSQSVNVLDTSIEKNIAIGETKIDSEKMATAIRIAQLEGFINSIPAGIQTIAGERGVKLSGGQRQRLGIARALYTEPEVLILDEATSALDQLTESRLTESLDSLPWKVTKIIVAHRLTTIEDCDVIIRLEKGAVVEVGDYASLFPKVLSSVRG
jgi:ATP-binding cassette, subfamily B, bacterial PglK